MPIIPVPMGFKDLVSGCVPEALLPLLTGHYTVIGTVAVIAIPRPLEDYKITIAKAILSHRHSVQTVLNKTAPVNGSSRTARYEILAGKDTVTTCREYGIEYELDVLSSFFNPRLSTERRRVAGMVRPDEMVLVPFAGVGPFVVPAARRGARVVAVEQNPDAFRWLCNNICRNGVGGRVTPIEGDAFDTSLLQDTTFDRVIIPTPYGMDSILGVLAPHVKPGGMIHFYTFRNKGQIALLEALFARTGYEVLRVRKCGNVAPSVARWVFDLKRVG